MNTRTSITYNVQLRFTTSSPWNMSHPTKVEENWPSKITFLEYNGGILSRGFCPGGFCPGGILSRGILSWGNFVQGDFVWGVLSGGILSYNPLIHLLQLLGFTLKFGIKQSKISQNFAEQLLPKAKISGLADDRLDNFSKDALI